MDSPTQPATHDQVEALRLQVAELTEVVRAIRASMPVQLVDVGQAAAHLGVSPRTLRRMVRAGQVPFRRVGRQLRFELAALRPAA